MASAPPMEPNYFGQPQPPTYEETITGPVYTYSPTPPPPVYDKMPQPAYPPPFTQPAYPPQAYQQMHPQQSNAAGNAAGTSAVVSVQTVYVQPRMVFGDFPVHVHCPVCAQMVLSRLCHSNGVLTWLTCFSLSLVGCIYGCCLIPFCVDGMKDVKHMCPNCNSLLGVYKRL
ncbi:hypothetical protein AALO_G00085430 [Alosa alosa]|uniref:LITAF domain-containing protein n=1 Tax=Alosa alosa TaxID=278164 RepID=A0AAV6H2B9_9TELE|nr:lipopolysaccharide-induced tumor necrosis factor-alpha factor homolog [Alosa alosa]KAG5280141.1 hypothetical protein AALO_G00085430 [Alosa alosa]